MRYTAFIAALAAALPLGAESLWNSPANSQTGMFADRKALQRGDILLVRVDEATIVNRTSSKNTSSSTSIDTGLNQYLFPGNFGTVAGEKPRIALNPQDSFNGEGNVSDSNVLTSRIAVLVVDSLPNGNLVVEGARKIQVNSETQYVVMRGIVRRDDVLADNSVMSYNVVNANIEFLGEGDIATAQKKGWINKLLDAVNIW